MFEKVKIYWPEIITITLIVIALILKTYIWSDLIIPNSTVKDVSGIIAQVLGGLLGLFLASYTVLYGINIKDILSEVKDKSKSEQIKNELSGIYDVFFETILWSAIFLIFSVVIFVFSTISTPDNSSYFSTLNPDWWNFFLVTTLLASLILTVLNLVESVRVLIDLKEI